VSTKLSISVEIPRAAPEPLNIGLYAPNLQVWRAGQSADNFLVSRAGTTLRRSLQRGTPSDMPNPRGWRVRVNGAFKDNHSLFQRQPSIFRAARYRSAVCPYGLCRWGEQGPRPPGQGYYNISLTNQGSYLWRSLILRNTRWISNMFCGNARQETSICRCQIQNNHTAYTVQKNNT
jgi:hypothetical protein